jgi:hypothetical protein
MHESIPMVEPIPTKAVMILFIVLLACGVAVAFRLAAGRRGGRAMRHYVWGVVVLLLVLSAAGFTTVRTVRSHGRHVVVSSAPDFSWGDDSTPATVVPPVPLPAVVKPPVVEPRVVKVNPRSAKRPPWWKDDKPEPPPADPGPKWATVIERSTFASQADSREAVLDLVRTRLHHDLHLTVVPNERFLNNQTWVHIAEAGRETLDKKDETYGEVVRIKYAVELTPEGWQELARVERETRSQERMNLTGRALAVLTVLLGAVAGYIRLDDWTKGYYAGRLKLAAVVAVAVAALAVIA